MRARRGSVGTPSWVSPLKQSEQQSSFASDSKRPVAFYTTLLILNSMVTRANGATHPHPHPTPSSASLPHPSPTSEPAKVRRLVLRQCPVLKQLTVTYTSCFPSRR
ncbi:hypothetical protein O3P69_002189 [Scylla paramamosain]|uniref:Uncharacterized protein n=1 Tax=Scylla paramamosain TaxID=85552 RepID=A0AAW0V619_SCYPA